MSKKSVRIELPNDDDFLRREKIALNKGIQGFEKKRKPTIEERYRVWVMSNS